jgi:XTP/dITP diphosphohydrolase
MGAVYFCSTNETKHDDVAHVFAGSASPPRRLYVRELPETLTEDHDELVREKAMAAYRKALVPLFVEHGALCIDYMNGLPGPMVKLFWARLKNNLCTLLPVEPRERRATQVQKVCYCDGRRLTVYTGRVAGTIADAPRGDGGIYWEPAFVPDGHTRTLGEMTRDERLATSASAQAFAALRVDLRI